MTNVPPLSKGPTMSLKAVCAPQFVISATGELYGEDTAESRDIARRIYACVAACEGISTEELEQGVVADLRSTLLQLEPLLRTWQASKVESKVA